jgi:hypothetical protein
MTLRPNENQSLLLRRVPELPTVMAMGPSSRLPFRPAGLRAGCKRPESGNKWSMSNEQQVKSSRLTLPAFMTRVLT